MLQLFDLSHVKLHGLTNYKDLKRERTLDGEEILSFLHPQNDDKYSSIQEETYLRTKDNEYVVKEINIDDDWTEFVAKINVEDLKGNVIDSFESVEQTITDCLNLALVSTGWTIGSCDVTKKRTVRISRKSSYDIIQEARKVYRCDYKFDSINKKIYIFQSMGADKGSYFTEELNLKKLNVQSNSYDFCTRIIPVGKNGLQMNNINNGKQYVENYQYSSKIITVYWEDNRYTDSQSLKEDAEAKLNEISKPVKSYKAEIFDLARLNDKYKNILDYDLGDTITLLSKDKKVKDKQRIVKIIEYPEEPERNTCEIANRVGSLEDLQTRFEDASDTVDTVTTSAGELDGSKVDSLDVTKVKNLDVEVARITNLTVINASIADLQANKATVQSLNAVTARVGTLETTTATITQLNATNAKIDDLTTKKANVTDLTAATARITTLEANSATITNLNAAVGRIDYLESSYASINTLLSGNIGAANIAAGTIQAGSSIIANGAIGNAQINDLDVTKLNAGDISTSKFRIVSASGNMLISDNTIQIKDASRVRVQIGKDASNDYNMYVWDASGNLMFDATGLKASGIKSKIIRDDMVSDTANINGAKLEKESLVTQINGATTTLKASKIKLDTENQTLDVAFTSLKSTVTSQGNTITSQGTSISTIQGQISSKIWSTDITSAINNMQIGGRNLLKQSNTSVMTSWSNETTSIGALSYGTDDGTYIKFTVSTSGSVSVYKWIGPLMSKKPDINKDYIISAEFKTNGTFTRGLYIRNQATVAPNEIFFASVPNSSENWQRIGLVFRFTKDFNNILIDINGTCTAGTYIMMRNIKIEEGVKATDWTPAPEDVQGQIDGATTRITTVESNINQLTTSISLKVDTSTFNSYKASNDTNITDLQTRMSSAELKITDSSIVSIVRNSTAYVNDLAAKSNNTIPDTRNDNQPPSWYWTNYPKQVVTEFKGRAIIGAPGSTTYGGLTTTVPWGDSSGGSISQIFRSDDGTFMRTSTSTTAWSTWKQVEDTVGSQSKIDSFNINTVVPLATRVSTTESSITQLNNSIALKVSQTDFNSLTGRVSTTESNISVLQGQISSKVNVGDFGTLVTQNASSVKVAVGQIGGNNLIKNSSFEMPISIIDKMNCTTNITGGGIDGNYHLLIESNGGDSYCTINSSVAVRPGVKYTFSFYYNCAGVIQGSSSYFWGSDGNPYYIGFGSITADGQWHRCIVSWTCPSSVTSIKIRLGFTCTNYSYFRFDCLQLEEGDNATAWGSNANELKSSCFEVTDDHARFTSQDGSYTEAVPGQTGLKWHKQSGDVGRDYHYLNYQGTASIAYTHDVIIQLSDEFKGKDVSISVSIKSMGSSTAFTYITNVGAWGYVENKANGTIRLTGMCQTVTTDVNGTYQYSSMYNYFDVAYTVTA